MTLKQLLKLERKKKMPKEYDFSTLSNVKEIEVNPDGWVNPITIEYGVGNYGEAQSYFWRVKGTKHTFIIPILRMDFLSKGEYAKHFQEVLEGFREDYKEWASAGWYTEWMQSYRREFSRFISV